MGCASHAAWPAHGARGHGFGAVMFRLLYNWLNCWPLGPQIRPFSRCFYRPSILALQARVYGTSIPRLYSSQACVVDVRSTPSEYAASLVIRKPLRLVLSQSLRLFACMSLKPAEKCYFGIDVHYAGIALISNGTSSVHQRTQSLGRSSPAAPSYRPERSKSTHMIR